MRQFTTIFVWAVVMSGGALAQDAATTVYLPAKDGKPAQTLNYITKDAMPVIESFGGDKPKNCPDDAYWTLSTDKLVNCANGVVYALTKAQAADLPAGAMTLIPANAPKPGTSDDPGFGQKPPDQPEVTP
jgi:hypothetical protein